MHVIAHVRVQPVYRISTQEFQRSNGTCIVSQPLNHLPEQPGPLCANVFDLEVAGARWRDVYVFCGHGSHGDLVNYLALPALDWDTAASTDLFTVGSTG